MTNPPFESDEGLPYGPVAENLQQSQLVLANFVEIDPGSVRYGIELAQKLQGIARAVSQIGLLRGTIEMPDLPPMSPYKAGYTPELPVIYTLKGNMSPRTQRIRTIGIEAAKHYGVTLSARETSTGRPRTIYEAAIPNDEIIDNLLMDDPIFWQETRIQSRDFRKGRLYASHPFSHTLYREDSTGLYFKTVQDLSRELLLATEN